MENWVLEEKIKIPCTWSTGRAIGHFLTGIRDQKKIWGIRCPQCRTVMVPPQDYCGQCFSDTDQWVEVSETGTLETYSQVYVERPYHPIPVPFAYGLIKLKGADTLLVHLVKAAEGELKQGIEVKAVWKEEREGSILDIAYFQPVTGGKENE